ncbi:MAG: OmpA family protein [bacterium]|nr:OmpA family protein [bacterium]
MARLNRSTVSRSNSNNDAFHMTWSDMTALLLTLFAYIISISTIDQVKLTKATQSINRGLIGQQEEYVSLNDFQDFSEAIKEVVTENKLESDVSVQQVANGMLINLGDKMLFESGSADLKSAAYKVLDVLASELAKRSVTVMVEGHTDDMPIHTEDFPSNWHLSSERAAEVVTYLIKNGVDPVNLTLIGYADIKPIIANTGDESRQKNRRVTLFVEPKRHVESLQESIGKRGAS